MYLNDTIAMNYLFLFHIQMCHFIIHKIKGVFQTPIGSFFPCYQFQSIKRPAISQLDANSVCYENLPMSYSLEISNILFLSAYHLLHIISQVLFLSNVLFIISFSHLIYMTYSNSKIMKQYGHIFLSQKCTIQFSIFL